MTCLGSGLIDPRGTVGRIYKEEHYTLLHTKYESSGACGFGVEDFFYVFPIVSLWELLTPPPPPTHTHTIYTATHKIWMYGSSGPCGFKDVCSIVSLWELTTPREDYKPMYGPQGHG